MPSSGSGTGTPISGGSPSSLVPSAWPNCAVSLARYAEIVDYDECALWGIAYDDQSLLACNTFWSEGERKATARALAQAQQMLEDFIRWPLCPTWITGQLTDDVDGRFVDEQPFCHNPIVTRWAYVIAGGIKATTTLAAGQGVSYADDDIAVVGPFAATIANVNEVHVYYPDSDREITPSKITYSGGNLTIEIPRCRLLNPSLFGQTGGNTGPDKSDTTNFIATVDVKRIYNDPSTNAELVESHRCGASCLNGCTIATDDACMTVRDGVTGIVQIQPATYSDGWTRTSRHCRSCYDYIRLNYLAGKRTLTPNTEDVIVRLAHSLMPSEPCGCPTLKILWERDRMVPETLTKERLNNPFGLSEGSWFAYQWAKTNAIIRASVL